MIVMKRTIRSYRMALDIEIAKWKEFRDALRKPQREIFETMLLRSKLYASAGAMAARPIVLETMFMSILLDVYKRLLELAAEIERLKNPDPSRGPESVEKLLQPPSSGGMSTCQATIEATLKQEDS